MGEGVALNLKLGVTLSATVSSKLLTRSRSSGSICVFRGYEKGFQGMSQVALRENPVMFRVKLGRGASELWKEQPDSYLTSIATECFGVQQRGRGALATGTEK